MEKATNTLSLSEIETWLTTQLSKTLKISPDTIDSAASFEAYGLDSAAAITLTGDIQEWLKCEVDPMLFFDYPTMEQLAEHLFELVSQND